MKHERHFEPEEPFGDWIDAEAVPVWWQVALVRLSALGLCAWFWAIIYEILV